MYGNNSPVLNREIKEAVNRSEGITPSDFLGKEVSSPEYYASNDAHAHRKRAKIEKDAEYTYSENKQLAKLSPWMSVNNLDVIITNRYALLNFFQLQQQRVLVTNLNGGCKLLLESQKI